MIKALVSTRGLQDSNGNLYDASDRSLTEFLVNCNLVPFIATNRKYLAQVYFETINPDILILSGGDDLGANKERDQFEFAALDLAVVTNIKVFGICRGAQLMAVHQGGKIEKNHNHANTSHEVNGFYNLRVKSFHNFVITDAPKFNILARSEDGQIEALRHDFLPWEGWMWHPERETDKITMQQKFIEAINIK